MTSTSAELPVDAPEEIASRVLYELLGRRVVWPPLRAIDVYPLERDIFLQGRPVKQVEAVVDSTGAAITGWQLYSGHIVRLPVDYRRFRRSCLEDEVTVTYVYGNDEPPIQVRYAINVLANELYLAMAGSSDCRLPKRVTSLARQGISMTIIDPQDYLDKGRTGVPEVDAAITLFNRSGSRSRARVYSDRHPPARRLSVEVA